VAPWLGLGLASTLVGLWRLLWLRRLGLVISLSSFIFDFYDVELIPHKSKNATDFITWGPDFRSQEALRTTATFHIKGPVLVDNSPYYIRVAIVNQGNKMISNPVTDTFMLPQQLGAKASGSAVAYNTTHYTHKT
jgi:hypothetical protein